jgi:hypothetical protein
MAVAPADVKRSIVEPLTRSIVTPGAAPPPQGAGEASFTNGANGTVDVYYFL